MTTQPMQIFSEVKHPSIWLIFGAMCSWILYSQKRQSVYSQFERIGRPWYLPKFLGQKPQTLFVEGYNRVIKPCDRPFVVSWWSLDNIILPPRYLPDLQRAKMENASFLKNFSDAVNAHYSVGKVYWSDRMGDILRKGMNPTLSSLTPLTMKEIKSAVQIEIGELDEFKAFGAVELMKNIAHRVVSRLLAGEELCRNEKFLRLSSQFGDSVFITGLIITTLPLGLLRRPVGWLIAQYHRWIVRRVLNIVDPIVAKRMTEAREAKNVPRYDDSIEWAIRLNDSQERDSRTISLEMLHILQAAAGAPGATLTHMIYQLLVEPKYIPLLADEMKAAMNSSENLNEVLSRLPLMDSFIMETNRMYPVGGVTAARTVMKEPWILHDGTVLPVGTRIGFPCKAIQLDRDNFEDALRFDGFRFARMNDLEGKDDDGATRYTAAMTSSTNLVWGFGKHACPGRFYAVKLAKMVFIHLLSEYEFQWDGEPLTKHPKCFEVEGQFLPNLKQKVQIKKKKPEIGY